MALLLARSFPSRILPVLLRKAESFVIANAELKKSELSRIMTATTIVPRRRYASDQKGDENTLQEKQKPLASPLDSGSNASSSNTHSQPQKSLPAAYYRGGTSRGLLIRRGDLPADQNGWGPILRGAMGSPDPTGRQLNGMGCGLSSLSKVCVVEEREKKGDNGVDVDYTFVQVGVRKGEMDFSSNCGNMSAAVGPWVINNCKGKDGITDGMAEVVIFNTNTGKIIKSRFEVRGGEAITEGDFAIAGVVGTGARIELAFQHPAASRTGKLLPTGNEVDDLGDGIEGSCVDVANPCIFVRAHDFKVDGTILPEAGDAHPTLIPNLDKARRRGAVKMGLAEKEADVPESVPKIIMVSSPADYTAISGEAVSADSVDLVVRSLSGENLHRAVQMTVALATAAAAKIPGSIVQQCVSQKGPVDGSGIILGHSSGRIVVGAKFDEKGVVTEATVYRTARRLFEGTLYWS